MARNTGTLLVIVTGAPATGKTTLGRRIADSVGLPFINKDGIKERLFDVLGWKGRAWSKRLGMASTEVLYHFVEVQLRARRPCLVESNFDPEFAEPRFIALKQEYPFEVFQIVCQTDAAALTHRFRRRAATGERHPGHVDHVLLEEFDADARQTKHGVLDIGGPAIHVDTTEFEAIDLERIVQAIKSVLDGSC